MLAPRSHNALSKNESPMVQEIVKLPGSLSLGGSFFYKIALHSSVKAVISCSSSFLLFDMISFMNFTQLGICFRTSAKGILICNFLNTSKNLENCLSSFCFWNLLGKVMVVCMVWDCPEITLILASILLFVRPSLPLLFF